MMHFITTRLLPFIAFFALLQSHALFSQSVEIDLPRYPTEEEKWFSQKSAPGAPEFNTITTPPPFPVRTMAEWEELQALVITWRSQPAILTEIVRAARLECNVIICCNDQPTVTTATNYLTSAGVDLSSNVTFIVAPSNSIWIRDYGPNCIYSNGVDSLYIMDWIYNRDRPKDNELPSYVAQSLGLQMYATSVAPFDLVNTGGNYMSDGRGNAFCSKLVLEENGPNNTYGQSNHSEAAVDSIMQQFMGIERYAKMEPLPYDVIHHIDMHMKLLDEETLLVGQYPPGTADGPQIEANIQYVLSNFNSTWGTPYKVVRVPMPPDNGFYPNQNGDYRTYANAVFVNKTVLVPFYEEAFDTTAQRIWEETLPGYTIVGINCNAIIPSLGAIHCITHEIGVNDPLYIAHQPILDVATNSTSGYAVVADIRHRSGIAQAEVYYRIDPLAPWSVLPMTALGNDQWTVNIPMQPESTTIYYYVHATAISGKSGNRPMPAPAGYWKFKILETSSVQTPEIALGDMYPNPASAITCIPVQANHSGEIRVSLFNSLGKCVKTIFDGVAHRGENNYFVDAANLEAGTYFVELTDQQKTICKKLVVQ